MKRIVHKINEVSWKYVCQFSDTVCGRFKGFGSCRWERVTCKQCLKRKQRKKQK